jgi:hypothetical protein
MNSYRDIGTCRDTRDNPVNMERGVSRLGRPDLIKLGTETRDKPNPSRAGLSRPSRVVPTPLAGITPNERFLVGWAEEQN